MPAARWTAKGSPDEQNLEAPSKTVTGRADSHLPSVQIDGGRGQNIPSAIVPAARRTGKKVRVIDRSGCVLRATINESISASARPTSEFVRGIREAELRHVI